MNVYLVERTDYDEPHPTFWVEEWKSTPRRAHLIGTGAEGPRRTVLSSFNAG